MENLINSIHFCEVSIFILPIELTTIATFQKPWLQLPGRVYRSLKSISYNNWFRWVLKSFGNSV